MLQVFQSVLQGCDFNISLRLAEFMLMSQRATASKMCQQQLPNSAGKIDGRRLKLRKCFYLLMSEIKDSHCFKNDYEF